MFEINRLVTNRNHPLRVIWRKFFATIPFATKLKPLIVGALYWRGRRTSQLSLSSIDRIGLDQLVICEASDESVPSLHYYGPERFTPSDTTIEYTSPACTAYHLRDAIIIGGSDLIIHEGRLLHPNDYNSTLHLNSLEQFFVAKIDPVWNIAKMPANSHYSLPCGVSILGDGAGNFAHFMSEVIPRIIALDIRGLYLDLPLVVDGWNGDRLSEILQFFNKHSREIINIGKWERVMVGNLIYVSPPTYSPQDFKTNFGVSHQPNVSKGSYLFNSTSLSLIREYVEHRVKKLGIKTGGHKRIYLERKAIFKEGLQYNLRHIKNSSEVKTILESRGFHSVDITELSFFEQLELISGAEVIASPFGAAMTNVLFAPSTTKVIGLSAYYEGADYSYWSNFMAASGNELKVVLGSQIKTQGDHPMHRPYAICTDSLIKALDDLDIR